jgi:hypothetical protein
MAFWIASPVPAHAKGNFMEFILTAATEGGCC